jgi:lipoprotein-anchoring transpeptidase ErfK/SrfK
MAAGAAAVVVLLIAAVFLIQTRPSGVSREPVITPEIAKLDSQTLRKQASLAEARVQKLEQKTQRLFPTGNAILVDTAQNQISLVRGSQVIAQAKCSTGSGLELKDTKGNRTWTFETPRGYFRVLSKVSNPVWYRPDWAFIEEGSPIPKDRASRAVADVLGDYALAFGDGYFIHGTLYTRMLGTSVTHGCIRVDDKTLEKIYRTAQPGTPIWIY